MFFHFSRLFPEYNYTKKSRSAAALEQRRLIGMKRRWAASPIIIICKKRGFLACPR